MKPKGSSVRPNVSERFEKTVYALAGLSALLLLLRCVSNLSFSEPLHLITSGSEEQSFLSLWYWIHGKAVYSDPHRIPFTSSYLNWLFYAFYGSVIKIVLAWVHLSDAWIPTIGRLVSLGFSIAGFAVAWNVLKALLDRERMGLSNSFFACVSFYLFFGPLPAFWPLTVRPDMAAVLFELLAFYFFLKDFREQPVRAALLTSLMAFLAWSFKQSNISIFISLMLFCVLHRHIALAGMMGLTFLLGGTLVLGVGGPSYRESTLFSLPVPGFSLMLGAKNFLYFIAESVVAIPGYAALIMATVSAKLRREILSHEAARLCGTIALVTTVYAWFISQKIGASENYFIPAGIFVTLFGLMFRVNTRSQSESRIFHLAFYAASAVNAALMAAIILGLKGNVSKKYEHEQNVRLLQCTQPLPRPVYSQTAYLNLPWMLGEKGSFVPGYTYWVEKDRGDRYERGGIEGLIKEGYFGGLVLERAKAAELSGAPFLAENALKHYVEQKSSDCPSTHAVFINKGLS